MAESLEREAPLIVYHPSRISNAEEFRALFNISRGQAVEHDIRAGKDGYSVQQGMFTDRLHAWNILPVSSLGGLENVLGTTRAVEIVEIAKKRDRSGKPFTMNTVKDNLFVKDLTVEELQRLGRSGGEEILALGEFLDLYKHAYDRKVKPGKLCIDIKDGDNFHNFDLSKLMAKSKSDRKIVTALHNIKSLDEAKRFGVVSLEGSIIKEFEEKPESPKSTLISTCIYAIPKEHLKKFDEYIANKNNPDSPGYFMQWLVKNKNDVHAVVYDDFWYDIGTHDSYKEVTEKHGGK